MIATSSQTGFTFNDPEQLQRGAVAYIALLAMERMPWMKPAPDMYDRAHRMVLTLGTKGTLANYRIRPRRTT